VVVLNKCDIATKEEIRAARKGIEQLCKNGFLHNADCIEVSAKTMLGIDALRAKLLSFTSEKALDENEMFFYADRPCFYCTGRRHCCHRHSV
ncbi:MAG: hypothetical protein RR573_06715, partial [Oscillospiraceae bacterium]